ncbi:ferredoxin-type protein NapF [Testudinibacter sp. TR-2022]|uniref:ferredoxin-type protein NapF n=1 Tax=Testudinibacter sp. TR-2022 TaxID=2585029 RepID=UPI00111AB987|nr:ferredoxin-type protein NapF [Testudinibacter sp. TR-2022]TNH03915.1 ferredoxin-type protein NapF [Pasteurellaceae bacterium Phil11]TNH21055.1 ferredoxin-type protein NapF [Testudinibacter sp. TR-2022]TNH26201.1 ferredoxin-type protein NapF [Testudinibacter sp. TR-2022]
MSGKNERYYQAFLQHNHISRRGLLRGVFNAGQKAQQQISSEVYQRQATRPPQAVAEPLFLKFCNGCGDCVSACPYGLIRLQNQKAVLEIDFCSCDLCGKCTETCQTGALHHEVRSDTELRPHFSYLCLRQKGRSCTLCETSCATNAISFDRASQKIILDSERCNGCGECKIRCPSSYIDLI